MRKLYLLFYRAALSSLNQILLTTVLLLSGVCVTNAQSPDKLINQFFTSHPNQQVYLQMDNGYYFAGDTVWFKAYVVDNGVPSLKSKNLFVDWFDESGSKIGQQVLPLINGMAAGQYGLASGLHGKNIRVVAYTRWMLNDSAAFLFHRDISLLQRDNGKPAKPETTHTPFLKFYPEGGALTSGIPNNIAFKTGPGAHPVHGLIKDANGNTVTSFASNHQGMGSFHLTPLSTYTAEWFFNGDSTVVYRSPLPASRPSGLTIQAHPADNAETVLLRRSSDLAGSYYLLGTSYGSVSYLAHINLETKDSALIPIPTQNFLDGTLTLTVLDDGWNTLGERVVFIKGKTDDKLELNVLQKGLSRRSPGSIELHYKGASAANLSITITDASIPKDEAADMTSYLCWSGQLVNGESSAEDLDLLALTAEWKHSNWKNIVTQTEHPIKFAMDSGYYFFRGKAIDAKGKTESVSFLVKKKGEFDMETLNLQKDGSFADSSFILFDSTWLTFRPVEKQKSYTLLFDQLPASAWDHYPIPEDKSPTATIAVAASSLQPKRPTSPDTTNNKLMKRFGPLLQEAVVRAPKKLSPKDSVEAIYVSDQFKNDFGYGVDIHSSPAVYNSITDLNHYLANMAPNFPNQSYNLKISQYTYLLDENVISYSTLTGGLPAIAYIKYFPRGVGSVSGSPTVALYTEKYNTSGQKHGLEPNEYVIKGYSAIRPFDTVSYQLSAMPVSDLRKTLYWNPSLIVSPKENIKKIEFINNELGGPIRIVIEGMDEDGNPIHLEKILSE